MIKQTMKAWRLPQFGVEQLQLEETEIPELGANDLLVKVNAASLNYRDKAIIEGSYNPEILKEGPITLASDAVGTVVKTGGAVTRFKAGDDVVTHVYTTWLDGDRTPEDGNYLLTGVLA